MAFVKHTRAEDYEVIVIKKDGEKIASLDEARSAEEDDREDEAESPSPPQPA
jgi:hypothetical protein